MVEAPAQTGHHAGSRDTRSRIPGPCTSHYTFNDRLATGHSQSNPDNRYFLQIDHVYSLLTAFEKSKLEGRALYLYRPQLLHLPFKRKRMVLGTGLVAGGFKAYVQNEKFLIFASGVSNSGNMDPDAFKREEQLLAGAIKN